MAQLGKRLPHKQEDLSSILSAHMECQTQQHVWSQGWQGRLAEPWSLLAHQPAQTGSFVAEQLLCSLFKNQPSIRI